MFKLGFQGKSIQLHFFFFLLTAMLRDGFLSCLEQCELLFSDKTNSDIFVFEIYYR